MNGVESLLNYSKLEINLNKAYSSPYDQTIETKFAATRQVYGPET
jgi:hypothetical protein